MLFFPHTPPHPAVRGRRQDMAQITEPFTIKRRVGEDAAQAVEA